MTQNAGSPLKKSTTFHSDDNGPVELNSPVSGRKNTNGQAYSRNSLRTPQGAGGMDLFGCLIWTNPVVSG